MTLRWWLNRNRIAPFLKDPANRARIKPEALWEHDQGAALTASDVMAASVERTAFYQHVLGLFERVDLPRAAVGAGLAVPGRGALAEDDRRPRDGHVPPLDGGGRHRDLRRPARGQRAGRVLGHGLPMGVQLVGRPRGDLELLRVARTYERAAADVLAVRPT